MLITQMIQEMNTTIRHRTIKVKPINVKYNPYIDSIKEVNDKVQKNFC